MNKYPLKNNLPYSLRNYQADAVEKARYELRINEDSLLIEAATGAGKSIIIAYIAHNYLNDFGKRVIVTGINQEIVSQNYKAFFSISTASPSIYCDQLDAKDITGDVVFASYQSIVKFSGDLSDFGLLVLDECHEFGDSHLAIINALKQANQDARVLGLTATPYRLKGKKTFHHYKYDLENNEINAKAFFDRLIFSIDSRQLISEGFLTPIILPDDIPDYSETGNDLREIIQHLLHASATRNRVLIFASSTAQIPLIMNLLPPARSNFITGEMTNRSKILDDFKEGHIKYLVNFGVLTTGTDIPVLDCVSVLRRTDSPTLHQQIAGRGMRLFPGKKDCLLLDYAGNLDGLYEGENVYSPLIDNDDIQKEKENVSMVITCPLANHPQRITLKPGINPLEVDEYGYINENIAHYSRRCQHVDEYGNRCNYMWTGKLCTNEYCGAENDIAARICDGCGQLLIDPNKDLHINNLRGSRVKLKRRKKESIIFSCDGWYFSPLKKRYGADVFTADFFCNNQKINPIPVLFREQKYGINSHIIKLANASKENTVKEVYEALRQESQDRGDNLIKNIAFRVDTLEGNDGPVITGFNLTNNDLSVDS